MFLDSMETRSPAAAGWGTCNSADGTVIIKKHLLLLRYLLYSSLVMNNHDFLHGRLKEAVAKYWGYTEFLPLQEKAIMAALEKRDSLVVLPTGGGKSLCFQAPALVMPGLAIVVSPLISLMKDQVDSLIDNAIRAAKIDSTQSSIEQKRIVELIENKQLKILYLSPERLVSLKFIEYLKNIEISFFAIDEAHCISMWGHDFRMEYRQLRMLRELFPDIAIHAFTATAIEQVRQDIVSQLKLKDPSLLVGSFDRPNLIFKAERRNDGLRQIIGVLNQHKNESGIIYCIRRDDVDAMCAQLNELGYKTLPYHAGLDKEIRKANQQAFIDEKVNIIVATVAFGMGIDKSNVRFVIHAGMPKSLEHYQQESGRAGRDGLAAECCLFYSGNDYHIWEFLLKDMPPEAKKIAHGKLSDIYDYCTGTVCRHKAIVGYFGQALENSHCGACDICAGGLEPVADSMIITQKILSCIIRLNQGFGADYTSMVLVGSKDKRVLSNNHDRLSTYGLLAEHSKTIVRDWIEQLIGQGFIEKSGEFRTLSITERGKAALKNEEQPKLFIAKTKSYLESEAYRQTWGGVDEKLFEELRLLRKKIADDKGLPAFVVFSDAVLRELATFKPTNQESFLNIKGIGEAKLRQYGRAFTSLIRRYCDENDIEIESRDDARRREIMDGSSKANSVCKLIEAKETAFRMFRQGCPIKQVAEKIERAVSTTAQYLEEFIERENLSDPFPWVSADSYEQVKKAFIKSGTEQLKPVFDLLDGRIDYESLRICRACLKNKG